MKKGTKFALFAAAAAGIAVVGSKLAQMVRLQNEELNDMNNQTPAPQPEDEDTSDYVIPGDSEEELDETVDDSCADEEDYAEEPDEEPMAEPVEESFTEDEEPDDEPPLA